MADKKTYKVIKDKEIGGVTHRKNATVELHPRQAKWLLGTWLEEVKPAKAKKAAPPEAKDKKPAAKAKK